MAANADLQSVLQVLQQEAIEAQDQNQLLRSQLRECKEQIHQLSKNKERFEQKISDVLKDNKSYSLNQERLETTLYDQEQEIMRLNRDINHLTKNKKEAEKKLTDELTAFERDRIRWQSVETELLNKIRSMPSSNGEGRLSRRRSATINNSPSPFTLGTMNGIGEQDEHIQEEDDAKISNQSSSTATADHAQKTIKIQDKLIHDLQEQVSQNRADVEKQKQAVSDQLVRMKQLEDEIVNVKHVNQSLMEENESYQILLHEKTISGEFMMNPIMQVESTQHQNSKRSSNSAKHASNGLNLAAELNLAYINASDWEASQKVDETDRAVKKLNEDIKVLQDTNRALQLYMNKILLKIVNNKQLEDVLSIDQPKAQDTSSTASDSSDGLLQPVPPAPAPTSTWSSKLRRAANNTDDRQQRRRTISYWDKNSGTNADQAKEDPRRAMDRGGRRHTVMPATEPPVVRESISSGFVKALRRMSSSWGSGNLNQPPVEEVDEPTKEELTASEDDTEKQPPNLSQSGSSTTSSSLRVSNDLETLKEE